MDKNKSRTDLLAAGRKKLQQYRQKKDKGSGSQGKSTKKSGKSEQHETGDDAVSTAAKPTELSQVREGEAESAVGSNPEIINTSESNSVENSADSDPNIAAAAPSTVPISHERSVVKAEVDQNTESPSEEVGVCKPVVDSSVQNDGERNEIGDGEVAKIISLDTSCIADSGGEAGISILSIPVDVSAQHDPADTTDGMRVTVDTEIHDTEKESLPTWENTNTSLMQETDAQEADGLEPKQSNLSHEAEVKLEGDNRLSLSEVERTIEPLSGPASYPDEPTGSLHEASVSAGSTMSDGPVVFASDAKPSNPISDLGDNNPLLMDLDRSAETVSNVSSSVEDQTGKIEEASVSAGATMSDGLSVSPLASIEVNGSSVANAVSSSFSDEKLELQFESGVLVGTERGAVSEDCHQERIMDDSERPVITNMLSLDCGRTLSPITAACSISLSQLTGVIRSLNTEEFRTLLQSIESVANTLPGSTNMLAAENGFPELFDRLKEELVLTNFTKDISHLQLEQQCEMQLEFDSHHHQLLEEMSLLRASFKEVDEKNQALAEEIAHCRSELQSDACVKEELQKQFHASKAEVEECSSRASELHGNMERAQQDLFRMSTELADCKNLVQALQVENENLNRTIASSDEDRSKLVEQNNFYLVENKKLSTELVDHESLVAVLQGQISNLNGSLGSVTEEVKRLEEEKEQFSCENEKLLTELADNKNLVSALQVDNASLNEVLSLVTEEKKNLEVEKEYSAHEIERLSAELDVLQERLSAEHEELVKVEFDLKETSKRLEQLTEENISLTNSLDILKANSESGQIKIPAAAVEDVNQPEPSVVQSRGHELATEDEISPQVLVKQYNEASFVLGKYLSDGSVGGSPSANLRQEVFDDSNGFSALNGPLDKADKMLDKLVQEIESICAHSASLSRLGDKLPVPHVSKLIQAFESKAHLEESVEEKVLTGDKSSAESFMSVREQTGNLKALFKQMLLGAANACVLLEEERDGRKIADATCGELKNQYEALEEYSFKMGATNIELGVLYEAFEQHRVSIETRNCELLILCESLQLQVTTLKAENEEADRKIHAYESRTSELQTQLHDLHVRSNSMVSQISVQLENFHKEAAEKVLMLERYWNSTIDPVVEATGKLEESLGSITTTTSVSHDCLDRINHFVASVYEAISLIQDLKDKLESSQIERDTVCSSYKKVIEKCDVLHGKNELASDMLRKLYGNLTKLMVLDGSTDESEMYLENVELPDPLHYSNYETIIKQVELFLRGSLQLESANKKIKSELMERAEEVEELKQRCLDSSALQKLIEAVEGVLKVEATEIQEDKTPTSRLESLVLLLVRKYEEADVLVGLSKEDFGSKVVELTVMQEEVQQLNALCLQHESELIVLRESLHQAKETLLVARSELEGKVNELEQSEQRVSSLREKLTIAVTKGKGLIVQRDGLKQSLTEKSIELERFSQELQLKDARFLEIETKLKAYSESGERVEALESELSYIRNSATALRESFLLKDSVLQRIEEILEDLDLPEHFHSRDIIEKIDWLARSATSNTFPATDSDQKSSAGGGSHSDAGVLMDSWKDDLQPSSDLSEDFKRKYDELQSKFYGVAEQNEMLEQSLMERNNIVQRWEEILDRIDMPSHLRSVEPEDRIDWLRKALLEVQEDNISLQQKVLYFENKSVSLTGELEDSARRISDLEADIQTFIHERDHLAERLEIVTNDHETVSAKAAEFQLQNENLQKGVSELQENIEADLRRLQSLVTDALEHSGFKYEYSVGSNIECLEGLLKKLLESYAAFSSERPVNSSVAEDPHTEIADATVFGSRSLNTSDPQVSEIAVVKRELEEVQLELLNVKEERDRYLEKQQSFAIEFEALQQKVNELQGLLNQEEQKSASQESGNAILKKEFEEVQGEYLIVKEERDGYLEKQRSLVIELEALHNKVNDLQVLLNQEEQKSASVREKLNVAVRKGKSLVQQRDSLKQNIDELNSLVERLRSEIETGEAKIVEYEQNFKDWSNYPGRVEALESETMFLRNCLNESEHNLQQKANTLSMIVSILGNIEVRGNFISGDPVAKLEQIGKMCCDLSAAVASSEQEARKSKRAAELLLAELNEVQERNDSLQEELAKSASELAILSKERDIAEAGKLEAVVNFEKLSTAHSEERTNQFSEFAGLKSSVDQLRKGFHDISNSLAGLFYKELEFFHNLESGINACLKSSSDGDAAGLLPPFTVTGGFIMSKPDKESFMSMDSLSDSNMPRSFDDSFIIEIFTYITHYVKELMMEIGVLKEKLDEHSMSLHEKSSSISRLMSIVHGEITSTNESFEAMKRDFLHIKMVEQEKDKELLVLRRNAVLLYEACTNSVVELDKIKAELVGNSWAVGDLGMTLKTAELPGGGLSFSGEGQLRSEEFVRIVTERLLSAASDFATVTAEIMEGGQKEMKLTISNLQNELQEKDIQKERIFMELVSQIKEAESSATSYSMDLESSKTLVHDLERQLEVTKGEHNLMEQRVNELEDGQATSAGLQERVTSLTNLITAKDHEIEELMQALDEEEVQMQGITYKIKELEKIVEQKNQDLENLEASRGKIMKKLSITVNKFDELHHLTASLLAEVEKLQSQLQDRDAEISFLRQEVTRCTNDVLVASQACNQGNSDEMHELLAWFDLNAARVGIQNEYLVDRNNVEVPEHKEAVKKTIDSIISELGDLRALAQSKDMLLQVERSKVEELTRKRETLEKSIREKESRLNLLEGAEDSSKETTMTSEIQEVEPAVNKWAASTQVRSLRKGNNEQVAIAIDMDPGNTSWLEDEEDDKVHGFKSLTTSRMVPRFTRPVSDMVDGLWVSCDRTLMRKPILRLGIIFYWAFLHALLASLAI